MVLVLLFASPSIRGASGDGGYEDTAEMGMVMSENTLTIDREDVEEFLMQRIIDGSVGEKFPFASAVFALNLATGRIVLICTAAVVSERLVITTGICGVQALGGQVCAGSNDLQKRVGACGRLVRGVRHQKFNASDPLSPYNIALMRTDESLLESSVAERGEVIPLSFTPAAPGTNVTVVSYGRTSTLQSAAMEVTSNGECPVLNEAGLEDRSGLMCASSKSQPSVCQEDAGAPLIVRRPRKAGGSYAVGCVAEPRQRKDGT